MSQSGVVDVDALRLLYFVLVDCFLQVGNGLLLRIHGVRHPSNHFLLSLRGNIQSKVVLVFYLCINQSLIVVPALVSVKSIRLDAVIHVF